jgi:hypothetical protein
MTVLKGNKRRITQINFFSDALSLWLWLDFSSEGFSLSNTLDDGVLSNDKCQGLLGAANQQVVARGGYL